MSDFPVLQRHMGAWEGTYTLLDPAGKVLDHHRCRLEISRDGPHYFQRNIYTWDDGRQQILEFPGDLRDGKLWFDVPRMKGHAEEVGNDIVILTWVYNDAPTQKLTEFVYLVDDTHRCRTWQFIENNIITKVMVINEVKVA